MSNELSANPVNPQSIAPTVVRDVVAMTSREIADLTGDQARLHGFNVCAVLATSTAAMARADDSTRAELYEAHVQADTLAMIVAQGIKEKHPTVARVIQDARMTATLTGMQVSPAAIALSRCGHAGTANTYIARNTESGLLKIGKSINPRQRMLSLQTGAGSIPELLLVIEGDSERKLHRRFDRLRVFGEWFRDDGTISAFIAAMSEQIGEAP